DEADGMAERVVVIDHGQIIADAPPAELKRDHADDVLTLVVRPDAGAHPGADLTDTIRGVLHREPETITVTEGSDGTLTAVVATVHGAERLPEAIEQLRLAGHTVTSADVKRASLDDVFLNLTGRSLREEAA